MRSACCAAQISQSPNAVPGSTEDAIVLRGFGCDIGARIRRAGSQFGKSYRTPRRDSNLKSKDLNESGLVNLNIINGEGFGSSQNSVSNDLSGRKLLNLKGEWIVIERSS